MLCVAVQEDTGGTISSTSRGGGSSRGSSVSSHHSSTTGGGVPNSGVAMGGAAVGGGAGNGSDGNAATNTSSSNSNNNKNLFLSGSVDRTVRIWDRRCVHSVGEFIGHTQDVNDVQVRIEEREPDRKDFSRLFFCFFFALVISLPFSCLVAFHPPFLAVSFPIHFFLFPSCLFSSHSGLWMVFASRLLRMIVQ